LFGGDYNPEQWTPAMGYDGESVWLDDLRLPATQRCIYMITVVALLLVYGFCRWLSRTAAAP